MVNFKKYNYKFGIYLPLGQVQTLVSNWAFCWQKCVPPLTCSRALETSGIVSEVEVLQDERLGLDAKFYATIQSKLLHFLLADPNAWSQTRNNIVGKVERGSQKHRR